MRRLFPDPAGPVTAEEAYLGDREQTGGRPWLAVLMIASVDGASALGGRSGTLGGPGDRAVLPALRSLADVVLVGAGTVRAEGYGPPKVAPERRRRRLARGQEEVPAIAVVTRHLELDLGSALFTQAERRPVVVTGRAAPADRRDAAVGVADVVVTSGDDPDLAEALLALGERGARFVLAEGGPSLNGTLLAADLVDEVCLTVAPRLAGGATARIVAGSPEVDRSLHLVHVLEDGGELFLRYVRR